MTLPGVRRTCRPTALQGSSPAYIEPRARDRVRWKMLPVSQTADEATMSEANGVTRAVGSTGGLNGATAMTFG